MAAMDRQTIAINYYFSQDELGNRIFSPDCSSNKSSFMRAFRDSMQKVGVNVVTVDQVDFRDPAVTHVLYFDYSWRFAQTDRFLASVPYEKRALVMIEPALVNPSLFFVSHYRKRFKTVFSWHLGLLKRNPSYIRINVPVGAEPSAYVENPFKRQTFHNKRFLVAVSSNRWRNMPHSAYPLRMTAYKYFERSIPDRFDLYGTGWNTPRSFWEQHFGCHQFSVYKGRIPGGYDDKVNVISGYKFALCFENNTAEPGYISEKITDCFCARCVPIYYGWKGAEEYFPQDAWINLRKFRNLEALESFLEGVDEAHYARYMQAIDRFMRSEQIKFFSMKNFFDVIAKRLVCPAGALRDGG